MSINFVFITFPRPPKTDVCDTCAAFKQQLNTHKDDPIAVDRIKRLKEEHRAQARHQQDMLSAQETLMPTLPANNEWRTICTDLQQVLTCPKVNTQSAYYKRKLSLYNQAITCLHSKMHNYYMWLETEGERGSDEIASCLYKWVKDHITQGFTKLRVIMDNCAGKTNIIL